MDLKRNTKTTHWSLWPTAWGPVGATATAKGISSFLLPHYGLEDLEQLMQWENPNAARGDEPFEAMIESTRRYFNARMVDFSSLKLDLPGPDSFTGIVLRACGEIPFGQTLSYSQLAMKIKRPDAARAVATALGKNPLPLVIPCHRVTYADGRPGGFSAAGGPQLKQRMLLHEAEAGA